MTPVVQIMVSAGPTDPVQLRAWVALWRRLLAEDPTQTKAPEVLASKALDGGTVASRTHEDLDEYCQDTPDC